MNKKLQRFFSNAYFRVFSYISNCTTSQKWMKCVHIVFFLRHERHNKGKKIKKNEKEKWVEKNNILMNACCTYVSSWCAHSFRGSLMNVQVLVEPLDILMHACFSLCSIYLACFLMDERLDWEFWMAVMEMNGEFLCLWVW